MATSGPNDSARRTVARLVPPRRRAARRAVLVFDRNVPDALAIRRVTPGTRLFARLRSHELDRELGYGADPDSCALLSVRATQLESLQHRRMLANAYRRRLDSSRRGPRAMGVPLATAQIRVCAALIEELAELLDSRQPIAVAAVACSSLLLTDPDSPMYVKATDRALADELRGLIAQLQAPMGGEER